MTNRTWWVACSLVWSFVLHLLLTYFWLDQHFHFTLLLFLGWRLLFRPAHGAAHPIVVFTQLRESSEWLESARTAIATHVVVVSVAAVSVNDWPTFIWPSRFVSPRTLGLTCFLLFAYGKFMKILCSKFCLLFSVFNQIVSAKLLSNAFSIIKVINGWTFSKIEHKICNQHDFNWADHTLATCRLHIINILDLSRPLPAMN